MFLFLVKGGEMKKKKKNTMIIRSKNLTADSLKS